MFNTVYPKKYAYGFCFAVPCCGYTLTDFPISTRLTSLAQWQSSDCPSASKATLMNMDKYFMWIHYERLHNHNKAKHNKTMCIFLGIYCTCRLVVCICVRHWFIEYHRKTSCRISISRINCVHRHTNLNIADSIMKGISIYALDLVMFDTLVCILVLRRIYRVPRQNGCSCFNSLERKLLPPLNQDQDNTKAIRFISQ